MCCLPRVVPLVLSLLAVPAVQFIKGLHSLQSASYASEVSMSSVVI